MSSFLGRMFETIGRLTAGRKQGFGEIGFNLRIRWEMSETSKDSQCKCSAVWKKKKTYLALLVRNPS